MENRQQNVPMSWEIVKSSRRGHTHIVKNVPNQDAIKLQPDQRTVAIDEAIGFSLSVALSDGHGSETYFRSDDGSRLATEAALKCLQSLVPDMAQGHKTGLSLSTLNQHVQDRLGRNIVTEWNELVWNHVFDNPYTVDETKRLKANLHIARKWPIDRAKSFIPPRPYGATLVIAAIGRTAHDELFLLLGQLGDGDVALVYNDETSAVELPLDVKGTKEKLGDETDSLCSDKAALYFQTKLIPLRDRIPAMILITTDGFPKSYRESDGFKQATVDLLESAIKKGIDFIRQNVDEMLDATSKDGSGDDMTLAMLFRSDVLPPQSRATTSHDCRLIPTNGDQEIKTNVAPPEPPNLPE